MAAALVAVEVLPLVPDLVEDDVDEPVEDDEPDGLDEPVDPDEPVGGVVDGEVLVLGTDGAGVVTTSFGGIGRPSATLGGPQAASTTSAARAIETATTYLTRVAPPVLLILIVQDGDR